MKAMKALDGSFQKISWERDEGSHGGGMRFQAREDGFFNRASINSSQVHYDDDPSRPLESATALSAIVHPSDPRFPSLHLHISFTKRKENAGTWRLMGDLNPSLPSELGPIFRSALEPFNVQEEADAFEQGDHYFQIPSLDRHRGVSHFYLEDYRSGSFQSEREMAESFGEKVISVYASFLNQSFEGEVSEEQRKKQLEYHTLYLFQVLLLDRGTTAGLLVHDQNDDGILGSLPARVDTDCLCFWKSSLPDSQQRLLEDIINSLGVGVVEVDGEQKRKLAISIRNFYKENPEALKLQATGFQREKDRSPHLRS